MALQNKYRVPKKHEFSAAVKMPTSIVYLMIGCNFDSGCSHVGAQPRTIFYTSRYQQPPLSSTTIGSLLGENSSCVMPCEWKMYSACGRQGESRMRMKNKPLLVNKYQDKYVHVKIILFFSQTCSSIFSIFEKPVQDSISFFRFLLLLVCYYLLVVSLWADEI
jgi:hypothetical protein